MRKMKFIFPQNYNFKSKIFGFIDYSTAIIDAVWGVIVFGIVNLFKIGLTYKIVIFIIMVFPVFLLSIVGLNGENIVNVCNYLIKYLLKPKVLLFRSNNRIASK